MNTFIKIFVLVFVLSFKGYSQSVFPLLPKYYQPVDSSLMAEDKKEVEPVSNSLLKKHDKVSYSVTVGTGFSSFGSGMSMMSSYISPSVNYQVNSKFDVTIDGYISQNNMNGMEAISGVSSQYMYNASPNNYGIMGSAYYKLSDRWGIYADGAYFENQSVFDGYSASSYNTDLKTISLGVDFKVNDNLRFNLQYRYTNGLTPYYNYISPFYNSFLSPYKHDIWDY